MTNIFLCVLFLGIISIISCSNPDEFLVSEDELESSVFDMKSVIPNWNERDYSYESQSYLHYVFITTYERGGWEKYDPSRIPKHYYIQIKRSDCTVISFNTEEYL